MTRLVWPNGSSTTEPIRSDDWGWRTGYSRPFHTGQDWYSIGSLKAIGAATVVENHWGGWAGWQVLLHLGPIDGVETWARYCHLASQPALPVGASLAIGATVGQEGNTGESEGNHLHLEIYQGAVDRGDGSGPASTVNPRTFIAARLNAAPVEEEKEEEEEDMSRPMTMAKELGGNDVEVTTSWAETGVEHVFLSTKTTAGMAYNKTVALAFGCSPDVPIAYVRADHYNSIRNENLLTRNRIDGV